MYQERRDGDKFIMRCGLAEKRARNEWETARERALHDLQDAMRNGVGGWGNGDELDSERVVREALEEKNLYERRTSVLIRLNVVGFNPVPGHESYRGPRRARPYERGVDGVGRGGGIFRKRAPRQRRSPC